MRAITPLVERPAQPSPKSGPGEITPRVGFTVDAAGVDPEVAAAVRQVAETVAALGNRVDEGGPTTEPFRDGMLAIVSAGMASLPLPPDADLDPLNKLSIAAGNNLTAADYLRALGAIRQHSRQVVAFWDDHDLLLTPTLTKPAPKIGTLGATLETAHDEYLDWLSFTYPYNCTGQPAISLPLAMHSSGLPIGVQLVGPPRGERTILELAMELEEALPWKDRRPSL